MQPSLIHVVSKPGREEAINAFYKQELSEEFLIWTKARIAERIRAVNAGQVEALAHLKGKLESINDWNRALPEMSEGRGSVLIADSEATLTPVQLIALRRYVLFIDRHKDEFQSIVGMETAQMLLGGAGRKGIGVVAPEEPKSEIYRMCVRHKRLDLWAKFYKFRAEPSKNTWAALKMQTVPWRTERTVDALVKALPGYSPKDDFPSALLLRRALLPNTGGSPDSSASPSGVYSLPIRDRR